MKKSILAMAIASSFILGACDSTTNMAAKQKTQNIQTKLAQSTSEPELGVFGIELAARNLAIKPGDDFFMYASGTWYDNFEMPSDKTRYGAFSVLADRSEERVKQIINNISKAKDLSFEEQLIANFYNAYMDIDTINAKGLQPIQTVLEQIDDIDSVIDLTSVFGNAWLSGVSSPINAGLGINRLDPNAYQMSVGTGGLGLPDRSYYLTDTERFNDILAAYKENIIQTLSFIEVDDAATKADQIIALETKIATLQWPREKRRNRDLTLNQIARSDLLEEYPGFDWDTYFASSGYIIPELNITQPDPVKEMIKLVNSQPLSVWQDYLRYHAISNNAGMLSDEIYLTNFGFYGTMLNGQKEPRPRWKRAIAEISGTQSLGFAIGKVYVDKYFPASSKEKMATLVENLRKALGERIDNLDWMGSETKVNAKLKLMAFHPKIGYPDEWQSFEGVSIGDDDLIGNVRNLRQFFQAQSVQRERLKTDRERWGMVPQQVNAYYNSSFNEIVFPAAILQAPFFDPNADDAVNYGAIGAVIGHEMGHGFDDQGSKSDANGIQRNWWTEEDRAAFDAKADKLAAQYSEYEPIVGNFVNGRNSLGENIGDVGGLAMAYHAYQLSLNGKEAPIIAGLTGDQRFFLAWAQVWREKRTEQSMLNQLRAGTHAPGRYRTQAPRNHDAWYKAFDVQPGDALYLAPQDRVRIW
ncbi:M13 family metallopeptidase [Brumicola pallidula]|uniref:Endothelin-converting protein 1 n=1 Tax=Brumicola pallidula DSM 14239 = ACAM 615 TaxID=1121922 RepID=K6ZIE6_9ALTE|nr:M13 family metallopeptidase [Glaciecola pallidula]GAC30127.1 endothelin-converting protein 1 [Glaciecola pallidula DSM 14239 = ACAM 615]